MVKEKINLLPSIPGDTLKESLEQTGMTQAQLALRTGLHRKTINGIINGREPITPATAIQLERVFRVPASFWINLQNNYDEALARQADRNALSLHEPWLGTNKIPWQELDRRGLLPTGHGNGGRLSAIFQFFGISNPSAFTTIWEEVRTALMRQHPSLTSTKFPTIACWLREGELEAQRVSAKPSGKMEVRQLHSSLSAMDWRAFVASGNNLERLCGEHGVILLRSEPYPSMPPLACSRWLSSTRALIQVSTPIHDSEAGWDNFLSHLRHLVKPESSNETVIFTVTPPPRNIRTKKAPASTKRILPTSRPTNTRLILAKKS